MKSRNVQSSPPAASRSNVYLTRLARHLVQHAARSAPSSLAERLEEEWLADFETRRGSAAQILFALGCCWATRVIAHDFGAEKVAVTSTAAVGAQKTLTGYAQRREPPFSRRMLIFLFIVAFHAVLIYALKMGLARQPSQFVPLPMQGIFPEVVKPSEPPPLLNQPDLMRPSVEIPTPEFQVDAPPDSNSIQQVVPEPTAGTRPPQPTSAIAVNRVIGGPDKGFPATEDFYPSAARRLGEEGVATTRVCVDTRGRLTGAPTIEKSSGSARLDEGALKLARAGSGHYRPSTEDGVPVSSCYSYRIKFALRE
jgi:periplasmic protein TonB